MRVVLTIAGSDSGAGAGIQADLKTISALGGYGVSVVTAVTAQNTRAVIRAEILTPDLIDAQLAAVFEDFEVAAVKTGMLGDARTVAHVAAVLADRRPAHVVVDPVMVSKTGYPLLDPAAVNAVRDALLPLATVVTPNVHEAQLLAGTTIQTVDDAAKAGRRLLEFGARAVIVKGGHLASAPALDVLITGERVERFPGAYVPGTNTHGTGCTFSAALATCLARGWSLDEAIRVAKAYVTEAIRHGPRIGRGMGPTDHFFYLRASDAADWSARLRLAASGEE